MQPSFPLLRPVPLVRYGSTAKHSRARTASMVCTIPGFGNRGSWPILRPPGGQPIRPDGGSHTVCDKRQEAIGRESVEAAGHYALGRADRSGNAASRGAWVNSNARKNYAITAVATLEEVLAKQTGSAGAETQGRGQGAVVAGLLSGPGVDSAEREEDRGSSVAGSKCGLRQGEPPWWGACGPRTEVTGKAGSGTAWRRVAPSVHYLSDLALSGTLYVDMDLGEGSSPVGLFLLCRELKAPAGTRSVLSAARCF